MLHVSYIWQNVLSVGRDGQCIMQSFARGERRIRSVPSSCFTMANLSPFQRGYGSLQFFSVYQDVPNRAEDDFLLTGLRQDEHTANAPGIFFEEDLNSGKKKKKYLSAINVAVFWQNFCSFSFLDLFFSDSGVVYRYLCYFWSSCWV